MSNTHFDDPTGFSPDNLSTARDVVKMAAAASHYPGHRFIYDAPALGRSRRQQNEVLSQHRPGRPAVGLGRSAREKPATRARLDDASWSTSACQMAS
ncbi:hypothetical protein [Paraburkholderia hospita]